MGTTAEVADLLTSRYGAMVDRLTPVITHDDPSGEAAVDPGVESRLLASLRRSRSPERH